MSKQKFQTVLNNNRSPEITQPTSMSHGYLTELI